MHLLPFQLGYFAWHEPRNALAQYVPFRLPATDGFHEEERIMRSALFTMGLACLMVTITQIPAQASRKLDSLSHRGTFVSASGGKMVMTGHNGKQHTHPIAKDATVTIDGKSGALSGLKKGMHITVTTDKTGNVTSISNSVPKPVTAAKPVAPAKSAPAPATKTTSAVK
jgi:hypothetical protein